MPAILPSIKIDSDAALAKYFMPHQINWIQAEDAIHAQHKQAFALAEKSVRIGWTHADSFKNVRKRLRFKERDYLFATKDYQSALEYVRQAKKFAEFFNFTKAIVAHGEDYFHPINFSAQKPDLGFGLMNQLSMGEKRFPRSEQDIAADHFALRKKFQGAKWIFSESTNSLNPASHCDIAWAGGLASAANNFSHGIGATLG